MPVIDDLHRRIYALSNPETQVRGDGFESTALITGPRRVERDGNTYRLAADATGPDPDHWPAVIKLKHALVWPHRLLLAEPELAGADVRFTFLPRAEIECWGGERHPGRKGFHEWREDGRHVIGVADDLDADETARILSHEVGHARHAAAWGDGYGTRFARDKTRPEAMAKAAENDPELREAVTAAITSVEGTTARVPSRPDPFAPVPRAERIIRHDERTAIRRWQG